MTSMPAAALPCTPQVHPRTAPLRSPASHFVPSQPRQLTANSFQSPYFTALAAYCKSPYPHCSAPAASEQEKSSQRTTADTALEILRQLTREEYRRTTGQSAKLVFPGAVPKRCSNIVALISILETQQVLKKPYALAPETRESELCMPVETRRRRIRRHRCNVWIVK